MERSRLARYAYRRLGRFLLSTFAMEPRSETVTLNLCCAPDRYARVFDAALARNGGRFVHTVLRSGDLAYPPEHHANLTRNIAFIAGHPAAPRFEIATPETLARAWPHSCAA